MCITIEIENYNMVNYNMVVVGDLSEKMDIYEFMSIFIKLKVKPVLIESSSCAKIQYEIHNKWNIWNLT